MARKSKFSNDDIKRAYTKANGNLSAAAKLAGMSYGGYAKRARALGLVAAASSQKEPDAPQATSAAQAAHDDFESFNARMRAGRALSLLDVCGGDMKAAHKAINAVLNA